MRCPSCGFSYPDNQSCCPSCGSENTDYAKAEQQKTLHRLEKEEAYLKHQFSSDLQKRSDRRTLKAGVYFLVGIVLILILAVIGSFLFRTFRNFQRTQQLQKLETALEAEDFDTLQQLLSHTTNSYQSVYDKYRCVAEVYQDLLSTKEQWESYCSFSSLSLSQTQLCESLSWPLDSCLRAYWKSEMYISDSLILGNEEALKKLQAQSLEFLTETLLLTEEEILKAKLSEASSLSEETKRALVNLSYERMQTP